MLRPYEKTTKKLILTVAEVEQALEKINPKKSSAWKMGVWTPVLKRGDRQEARNIALSLPSQLSIKYLSFC